LPVHLLNGDERRDAEMDVPGRVHRDRPRRGGDVVGQVVDRNDVILAESEVERLELAAGGFDELGHGVAAVRARVLYQALDAFLGEGHVRHVFRHETLLSNFDGSANFGLLVGREPVRIESRTLEQTKLP